MSEKYIWKIIRDTREKRGFWRFNKTNECGGVMEGALQTGDYSISGLENIFSIERKASSGELAGNITTKQFENELTRGDKLKHFFILLEFTLENIYQFPYNSGIPNKVWNKLRVTPNYFIKRLIEIETNHNVKIIFCGNAENAKEVARAIFKEMAKKYPNDLEMYS